MDKVATKHAKKIGHVIHVCTSYKSETFQMKVFKKWVCEPFLNVVMSKFVVNCKALQDCAIVCSSLATTWANLKYGSGKDHYLTRNVVEAIVVSMSESKDVGATRRWLGLNIRFLKKAVQHKELLEIKVVGKKWAKGKRKHKRDVLLEKIVAIFLGWWANETRVSPNKKYVTHFIIRM
jgi:hypothetical protein